MSSRKYNLSKSRNESDLIGDLRVALEQAQVALNTIREFPVTDPNNQDAINMKKIAADWEEMRWWEL